MRSVFELMLEYKNRPLADLVEAVLRERAPSVGLELRQGQISLAREIANTLDENARDPSAKVLLAESPTGSGKSIAYLTALALKILRVRQDPSLGSTRAVISTAGIALQSQILTKDLPLLNQMLGLEVTGAVVKARSNYLCRDRIEAFLLPEGPMRDVSRRLNEWLNAGGDGDIEHVPFPISAAHRSELTVSAEECIGQACPFSASCASNIANANAKTAAVLVTNHSYLARASMALAKNAVGIVIDEAHEYEDATRRSIGERIGPRATRYWQKLLQRMLDHETATEVSEAIHWLQTSAAVYLGKDSSKKLDSGWFPSVGHVTKVLKSAIAKLQEQIELEPNVVEAARLKKAEESLTKLMVRAIRLCSSDPKINGWIATVERAKDSVSMSLIPLYVGPPRAKALVLTSATLVHKGSLAPLAEDLGLEKSRHLILPSPWPIASMGFVFVPPDVPPIEASYRDVWANQNAERFIRSAGGGVLVLASSYARAEELASSLKLSNLPWEVRVQGEAGRAELLEWFKADKDSVLVGTRSFFAGIDVPGDSLRGVVIDRIPFPSPSDPLEAAVAEMLSAEGKNPFRVRTLRIAAATFRQGLGRLLRSSTDRGVVCVLDSRLVSSGFSSELQKALAPFELKRDWSDVEDMYSPSSKQSQVQLSLPRSIRR
jgi:ATP-dependent DNA helicase DinG